MLSKLTCTRSDTRVMGLLIIIITISIVILGRNLNLLGKTFFNYKNFNITGWSIVHIIFFFILGLVCSNQFKTAMSIGLVWEMFETSYGYITNDMLYWTSGGLINQFGDLLMNFTGYSLAHILQMILNNYNIPLNNKYVLIPIIIIVGLCLLFYR